MQPSRWASTNVASSNCYRIIPSKRILIKQSKNKQTNQNMDSTKKVKDCQKILSTITDNPPSSTEDRKGLFRAGNSALAAGKSRLPFASTSKSLSHHHHHGHFRGSVASSRPLPPPSSSRLSPSNLTIAHKLDFSDESALLNNSTAMELTSCSPGGNKMF